jgi:leucyl-tRNA synthetase
MTQHNPVYSLEIQDNSTSDAYYYALTMFPYPSWYGLHVGHASVFTINDVVARWMRMQGYKVLNPFGFDSFGLPTENYAMKQGKPAYQVTQENGDHFLQQIEALQLSFDMSRIVYTSNPDYYKRTQWIFSELYKAWLVYRDELRVNWCPDCQTVLANDQVIQGTCERCSSEIIQKETPQWFIKITAYADRLLQDLDTIDRPEATKIAQKNWIGRSEWAEIHFEVIMPHNHEETTTHKTPQNNLQTIPKLSITTFTTRPDTLYGVTALMIAPENTMLDSLLTTKIKKAVEQYRKKTLQKTAVQRQQDLKDKSWVFSWLYAKHPITNTPVAIRYADYVVADYGSGAVMSVPAHDERDREFAAKNNLAIREVIHHPDSWFPNNAYTWGWVLKDSGEFTGMSATQAKLKIIEHLEKSGTGAKKITYKLRDWSVSRQRYRWSPIPIYYDENNNPQLIPQDQLPVLLPLDIKNYKPKGKSPLADHPTFPLYTDAKGKTYRRECDTLDTFMCSSFYYLRFIDPSNTDDIVRKERAQKLLPVDFYLWGKEHTVWHLLYARFIHKFLYDKGYLPTPEPFQKLIHQGMVQWSDGRKMGKRYGNVIDPMDEIKKYNADTLRTYLLFMGPVEADKNWSDDAIAWVHRFLQRVKAMEQFIIETDTNSDRQHYPDNPTITQSANTCASKNPSMTILHKTIFWVTQDIQKFKFNTAISKLMVFVNHIYTTKSITPPTLCTFLQLLAPFAPVLTQEIRSQYNEGTIHNTNRPTYDPSCLVEDEILLPIQINGKKRCELLLPYDASQETLLNKLQEHEYRIKNYADATIKKVLYIPWKIANIIL